MLGGYLFCDACILRCSWSGSIFMCRVTCVHPVAVLNFVFCVACGG